MKFPNLALIIPSGPNSLIPFSLFSKNKNPSMSISKRTLKIRPLSEVLEKKIQINEGFHESRIIFGFHPQPIEVSPFSRFSFGRVQVVDRSRFLWPLVAGLL